MIVSGHISVGNKFNSALVLGVKQGPENVVTFVGQRMLDGRGPRSFITGPSTANQASICQAAYLAVHGKGILNMTSCRLAELLSCSRSYSRFSN